MTRSISLFTMIIAVVASANAQDIQFKDFKVRNDQNVWTYSMTCPKSVDSSVVIQLEIPRTAYVKQVSQTTESSKEEKTSAKPKMEYSLQQKRENDSLKLTFLLSDSKSQTITFEVIAPKNWT